MLIHALRSVQGFRFCNWHESILIIMSEEMFVKDLNSSKIDKLANPFTGNQFFILIHNFIFFSKLNKYVFC